METISYKEYREILREIGVSYLAGTKMSAKMRYSYDAKVETYCLYLAPATMSGHNVCPKSEHCKAFCLNGSGQNRPDIQAHGVEHSRINTSRIKKTRFFFSHREKFMKALVYEICKYRRHAEKNGYKFAVRLNGTSDLSPTMFHLAGKNILEMFPDVQFYDYTKVAGRIRLQDKYENYDVTFSYDGYNWDTCAAYLAIGGKVAVVFENEKTLPVAYKGFAVHNASFNDARFLDPSGIMGLHYHRTANDYKSGKYERPNTPFVVRDDAAGVVW